MNGKFGSPAESADWLIVNLTGEAMPKETRKSLIALINSCASEYLGSRVEMAVSSKSKIQLEEIALRYIRMAELAREARRIKPAPDSILYMAITGEESAEYQEYKRLVSEADKLWGG